MSRHHVLGIAIVLVTLSTALGTASAQPGAPQPGPAPAQPPPGWAWHPQAGWIWVGTAATQQPAPPQPAAQPPAPQQPGQPAAAQPPAAPPQAPVHAPAPAQQQWAAPPAAPSQPPAPAAQAAAAPANAAGAAEPSAEEPTDWASRVHEAAMRPRLTVQGYTGAGGEAEVQLGHEVDTSDMAVSPGVATTFVMPVAPYFAAGALTGIRFWRDGFTEQLGLDAHLMWDIDAVLQLRLPFSTTGSMVYLNVPFGISLDFMDDAGIDWDEDLSTNVGFNAGVMAGAQFMFGRVFGVMVEVGYAHHSPSVTFESRSEGKLDIDWSFSELSVNTGLVFAF